ncbi:hypothetical protein CsSME_00015952 [Camellia sinensis var. sinensis]
MDLGGHRESKLGWHSCATMTGRRRSKSMFGCFTMGLVAQGKCEPDWNATTVFTDIKLCSRHVNDFPIQ